MSATKSRRPNSARSPRTERQRIEFERTFTKAEAAARCDRSVDWINRKIRDGALAAVRDGRSVRIFESSIDAYFASLKPVGSAH